MSITKLNNFNISNKSEVKVTTMGDITEVMYLSFVNEVARIRKIDKNTYEDLTTHEIKEFNHYETRACSKNGLRKTFRKIRNTINANITDVSKVRFITLTYNQEKGPMTDTKKLCNDFDSFRKRFKRFVEKMGYSDYEYINVVEPQGNGAWHCHVLFIFKDKAPFLENSKIRELWGHGWVTVRALKKNGQECDNVGAYLTAYLGDLDLESALENNIDITEYDVKEVEVETENGKQKKYFIKGARLNFYPPGFNIFRASRGIKRPVEENMNYFRAKKKVRGSTLTFQSHVLIETNGFRNVVSKKYYNKKAMKRQGVICKDLVDIETGEIIEKNFDSFEHNNFTRVTVDYEKIKEDLKKKEVKYEQYEFETSF